MGSSENKPELIVNGKRLDGRAMDELRSIRIVSNVIKNADGSAYIEWGNNKIIAGVYGPKEALPKHTGDPEKCVIKCRYQMAPFSSLEEHGRTGPNRRAIEISKVTKEVFENVVLVNQFPGNAIEIYIEVLQSDGGTRAAGITCAAVAMATSGIPMRDLPFAVSVGKTGEDLILDMNKIEDNYSEADVPICISPRTDEMLLLQMDGSLTKEQFTRAVGMVKKAGETISRLQKEALRKPYEMVSDKYKR